MKKTFTILLITILCTANSMAQDYKIGVLKYNGGGDWYANPTSVSNLIKFCNKEIGTSINYEYDFVEVGSQTLYSYPFVHMTGHGNVVFSDKEIENLRAYLIGGGFLHIDDNYGMDAYIRIEMKKVFPELEWVALSKKHELFQVPFSFPGGLPKVHVHDNKAPEALAMIWKGRIICLYTHECDLGDGWEDQVVHGDSEEIRLKALQMGANILSYACGS